MLTYCSVCGCVLWSAEIIWSNIKWKAVFLFWSVKIINLLLVRAGSTLIHKYHLFTISYKIILNRRCHIGERSTSKSEKITVIFFPCIFLNLFMILSDLQNIPNFIQRLTKKYIQRISLSSQGIPWFQLIGQEFSRNWSDKLPLHWIFAVKLGD